MTLLHKLGAGLLALLALLGYVLGLKRKAAKAERERDAERILKEHAQGEQAVAEATAAVVVEHAERQAEAVVVAAEYRAEVAATLPAEPTPADVARAADDARRKRAANTKRKIAASRKVRVR